MAPETLESWLILGDMESMQTVTKSQERRSARFWVFFILALFGVNLLMALVAIVIAVGDPSFRPMPSYGKNAVDWESRKQMQARSDALQWTAQVERMNEPAGLRVTLADASGNPVTGVHGTVQAYHFTRANESVTVPLTESSGDPGVYLAALDTSKDGRWQITVNASRGTDETFVWDQAVEWYR